MEPASRVSSTAYGKDVLTAADWYIVHGVEERLGELRHLHPHPSSVGIAVAAEALGVPGTAAPKADGFYSPVRVWAATSCIGTGGPYRLICRLRMCRERVANPTSQIKYPGLVYGPWISSEARHG